LALYNIIRACWGNENLVVVSPLWLLNEEEMTKQFSKLTDYQWAAISPLLPLKRKRKLDLGQVIKSSRGCFARVVNGETYRMNKHIPKIQTYKDIRR